MRRGNAGIPPTHLQALMGEAATTPLTETSRYQWSLRLYEETATGTILNTTFLAGNHQDAFIAQLGILRIDRDA